MNDDVISGASWDAYCDALKQARTVITASAAPATGLDRAEAWRFLSRLSRLSLEMMLEFADPDFPVFYAASHDTIKLFAPNPDNLYLNATIAGDRDYRIRGTRGTVAYLSFGTKANRYASDGTMVSTGELDATNIAGDADGRLEIVLSRRRQPGLWLPLADDSNMVIVRETFLDRAGELPAVLSIERIGGPAAPQPLTPAKLDAALRDAGDFVVNTARFLAALTERFAARPNELHAEPYKEMSMRAGGDPNIDYFHGYWSLAPDQALVIDSDVPDCPYWNFQLNNWYMESLDYRYRPVAINKHAARLDARGRVTVVVAERNPGVANFVDTDGHACGTMLWRWVGARMHPRPQCRVVALASLD
jgi:hypothetical protein